MQTSGIPNNNETTTGGTFSDYTVMYESESGYSVLYRAQKGGKWFALKGIKKSIGEQAKFESILRREFDLHKKVTSIYCAECYELIQDPNVGLCIVMQYVDGITLSEWLKQKPNAAEKRRVLAELLEAIGELHLNQIIHQDIKPANILITNNGHHVKHIDFGLSDNDAYILRARGCTNRYASPELKAGGDVSFASDIWSLGGVIKDLFPHRYCSVRAKCHRQDPKNRYKSVNALVKAISRTDVARTACMVLVLVLAVAASVVYLAIPRPTAEEMAYDKILKETHVRYDSCFNACAAKLDTCDWKEFGILYITDFSFTLDHIRQQSQPTDSLQSKNFYDDYLFYHFSRYNTLQEKLKDKPYYTSLPSDKIVPVSLRHKQMSQEIRDKFYNKH